MTERLYAGWCEHGGWAVGPSSSGIAGFPDWMSDRDRADLAALFEDERFSDEFRLTSFGYYDGHYDLVFYSAIVDSALKFDRGYHVFTGYDDGSTLGANVPSLAYGWWLSLPDTRSIKY